MHIQALHHDLEGPKIILPDLSEDSRGSFLRAYCPDTFPSMGVDLQEAQWSLSNTRAKGVIRGLHFQGAPSQERKLVRCVAGAIWDVVVDIRDDSPSFGKWASVALSAENRVGLYIPEGFAHGFQTLEDNCAILYAISPSYDEVLVRGIRWDDPNVGVEWPMPPTALSDRDKSLPYLREDISQNG